MISFIIVNYNLSDYVENCIRSVLKNCNDYSYEFIIVDNDSIMEEKEKLHKLVY